MFLDGICGSVPLARIVYARLAFVCVTHVLLGDVGAGKDEAGNDLLSQS